MNEPDDQQRWQALFEDLGLPPEPETKRGSATSHSEPQPEPVARKASGEEAASSEAVTEKEEASPRGRRRRVPLTEERESDVETVVADAESSAEKEEKGATEASEAQEAPRGRRRRRRGKAAPAAEEAEAAPTSEEAQEPAREGPVDKGGRRRRGPGGKKRESEGQPRSEATGEAAERDQAAEEEVEVDDMSDWVVPSWNELIASLYRPER